MGNIKVEWEGESFTKKFRGSMEPWARKVVSKRLESFLDRALNGEEAKKLLDGMKIRTKKGSVYRKEYDDDEFEDSKQYTRTVLIEWGEGRGAVLLSIDYGKPESAIIGNNPFVEEANCRHPQTCVERFERHDSGEKTYQLAVASGEGFDSIEEYHGFVGKELKEEFGE